tara:strand:- start:375 stop:1100 length:726 start_codon:yes stop_codon:yes gene_type:complete
MESTSNQEMYTSLCRFINKFKIDVDEKDVELFYISETKRRSIYQLDTLTVVYICSFMDMRHSVRLLLTCKSFIKYIDDVWLMVEKNQYPNSTLSTDGESVSYIKKNLALYEIGHIFYYRQSWSFCTSEIEVIEKRIKKLLEENKKISEAKDPTVQSIDRYKTNKCEIKVYRKEIEQLIEQEGKEYKSFLKDFSWLFPDGYLSNIPTLDNRLMNDTPYNSDSDNEHQENEITESDHEHHNNN